MELGFVATWKQSQRVTKQRRQRTDTRAQRTRRKQMRTMWPVAGKRFVDSVHGALKDSNSRNVLDHTKTGCASLCSFSPHYHHSHDVMRSPGTRSALNPNNFSRVLHLRSETVTPNAVFGPTSPTHICGKE